MVVCVMSLFRDASNAEHQRASLAESLVRGLASDQMLGADPLHLNEEHSRLRGRALRDDLADSMLHAPLTYAVVISGAGQGKQTA
jgi:hypothetical protein